MLCILLAHARIGEYLLLRRPSNKYFVMLAMSILFITTSTFTTNKMPLCCVPLQWSLYCMQKTICVGVKILSMNAGSWQSFILWNILNNSTIGYSESSRLIIHVSCGIFNRYLLGVLSAQLATTSEAKLAFTCNINPHMVAYLLWIRNYYYYGDEFL